MSTVEGIIVVPGNVPPVRAARAIVRIRDISHSDTRAEPVAEIRKVVDVTPEQGIPFSIDIPADKLSEKIRLNLEVHIDLDGSGHFSPGDLVSMEPYRILPDTREIEVPVSVV